ncbi:MAG: GNAT family N-acetyltransferase [Bacteroidales bacterium]|nr:GNAT family N-acetyltransferase [Bacteroidales bacterium]
MEIRKITRFSERTFEAASRLLPQLSPEAEVLTREYFKNILGCKSVHFFVARLDDRQIVGMLSLGSYKTPTGIKVWIEDVVVDKSQRGKGIGKELMLFAIDYSKSLGAKDVKLTSRPARVEANELYRKLGFKQYETNFYRYFLND